MKIFNRSSLAIDRPAWHSIAKQLSLDGSLESAWFVDRKELTVVVQAERPRDQPIYGESTVARIDIFPCRACSSGTLYLTFLHELAHVWLQEFHEDHNLTFPQEEDLCESFAQEVFASAGGKRAGSACHLAAISSNAEVPRAVLAVLEQSYRRAESQAH